MTESDFVAPCIGTPHKDDPLAFWFVLVGVGLFALLILGIACARRWL